MAESVTSRARRSSVGVSGWSLRRKVALALTIPLALAAILGALRVNDDRVQAVNYAASASQVTVLRPAVDYLTAASQGMVAAQTGDTASLDRAVSDLGAAAESLRDAKSTAELTPQQAYQVDSVLDLSRALRENTDTLSPGTWVAQLRQIQSRTSQLITSIVNAQLEPEPRLELLGQALAGRFSLASQQAMVATERTGDTGSLELFAELGVEGAAIDRLAGALGSSEPVVAGLRTQNANHTRAVRTGKQEDLGGADAYQPYDELITTLLDEIDQRLTTAAADARRGALTNAALVAGALLLGVVLALLVAQLLLDPIRRIRRGALAVAEHDLPDEVARIRAGESVEITPIDVHTREEVGQLARAVDDLHQQAVTLAAGEAQLRARVSDMFITLSRRSNSLVNQQLEIIDGLERQEKDPARLESLFRLDHLVSRMRRTADSLLLLSDAETRSAGLTGLTLTDVLQAATSGVTDYRRVRLGSSPALRVRDEVAGDLIHLLTELVDNAISYSAPGTEVAVQALTVRAGSTIEVEDHGIGMAAAELDQVNEALAQGGDVTAETARRMGLFVVARLAKRHGVQVRLSLNQHGGITAAVLVPASALPDLPAPGPVGDPGVPPESSLDSRLEEILHVPSFADRQAAEPEPETEPQSALPVAPAPASASLPPAPAVADVDDALDSPIFRTLNSAWFGGREQAPTWSSGAADDGWQRAGEVAGAHDEQRAPSGLPQREPGHRLVPGGLGQPAPVASLDPEAIRRRLAAHSAGVTRGRHAIAGHQAEEGSDD